ncbi:hypothetical protein C8J56DRAFT_880989 [Mycena floridula]|nr:hypothetical protein C8J56DRAFT_880989 [Mycena floridula]
MSTMFQAAPFVFAQELVDAMVDFIRTDIESLCACSLVSRAWLASAQRHIFPFSRVQSAQSRVTCRRQLSNLETFLEILHHKNSTIAPFIRGISADLEYVGRDQRASLELLLQTLHHTLESLSLLFPPSSIIKRRVCSRLQSYTPIFQNSMSGSCHDPLLRPECPLLRPECPDQGSFTKLGSLLIDLEAIDEHLRILTLHTRRSENEDVFDEFLKLGWTPRIEQFNLITLMFTPFTQLNGFLARLSGSLESLKLQVITDLRTEDSLSYDPSPIDLKSLARPRCLEIHMYNVEHMYQTLETLSPSSNIQRLSLIITEYRYPSQIPNEVTWTKSGDRMAQMRSSRDLDIAMPEEYGGAGERILRKSVLKCHSHSLNLNITSRKACKVTQMFTSGVEANRSGGSNAVAGTQELTSYRCLPERPAQAKNELNLEP